MPKVFDCQYPTPLRESEETLIRERRDVAGVSRTSPAVGLALSGGGIRSATFCLGVLRALAEASTTNPDGINLRSIDLLSTVSGGSYMGTFLGALFNRPGTTPVDVERQLTSANSRPVHWLRENGRYLAPNGSGDQWLAASTILRNWVALAVVMGVTVLAALMVAQFTRVAASMVAMRLLSPDTIAIATRAFNHPTYSIYWSALLLVPIVVLLFGAVPLGWAYWLGRWRATKVDHAAVWIATIVVTLASAIAAPALYFVRAAHPTIDLSVAFGERMIVLLGVLAVIGVLTLLWAAYLNAKSGGGTNYVTGQRTFRNLASRGLTGCIIATAALLGVALVDTLGQTVYVLAQTPHVRNAMLGSLATAIGIFLAAGQKITTLLDKGKPNNKRVTIPLALVAGLAGLFVTFALLGGLSAVSHVIARGREVQHCTTSGPTATVSLGKDHQIVVGQTEPCDVPLLSRLQAGRTAIWAGVFVALTLLLGQSFPFVNLSSLTQFYSARLSRTYIGASNKQRQDSGATITEEMPDDDLELSAYSPQQHGGPLHVINVTLNETVGGRSQVEDRDRKGLAMAVGPAGLSVGVTHHALWSDAGKAAIDPIPSTSPGDAPSQGFHIWSTSPRPIQPKQLSLSQWTAISGAAVATGMGAQTSLGLSLLLGIANVRLGYWWDSKVAPAKQGGVKAKPSVRLLRWLFWAFPVQSALMQELLAQFHGPHRQHWYLTDGGHFENTGCYELLRRRVPLIVVCDDGADPDYAFDDLANLVRKARLDFDAHVSFLIAPDDLVGRFQDLERESPGLASDKREANIDLRIPISRRHLIVARVDYPDGDQIEPRHASNDGKAHSLIIVVKPSLTGDEPLDVLQYAASHPAFPQEPTANQFFDEAQWESYRRLGEHIGRSLTKIDVQALWASVNVRANITGTEL